MKKNWISWLALALSIAAICFSGFRMEPVTFGIDRYNFSIDVLSLLVTLLIGWQVINVISFEKRIKKIISNEIEKVENQIENRQANAEGGIFLATGIGFYYTFPLRAYKCFIYGIGRYLDCEDFVNCNICLKNMELVLKENEQFLIKNYPIEKDLEETIQYIKNHPKYEIIRISLENVEAHRKEIYNKSKRA
ncbi:hypothetical protein [Bacteroides xylanisolvens]|jgi:hypothetical protein|uniref:hypothetical protein n=1 Tax=Bacteroides xylanisolvens TaxID=371601 RepID=UPI001C8BB977|nr:hypothetical protein [Bacteroides xylanisolvens]